MRSPGSRQSRALDGQQPGFVFATVERHALLPLPRNEFQLAVWSTGKVATDCHVKVGKALYSVPWRLMGQQVHARTCGDIVQIVHDGDVVATHVTHHGGPGHRLRALPAGEDRLHDAQPHLVPPGGRRGRTGLHRR